jgi:DNA-binding transcriptional ArsR family regulator
MSQVIDTIRGQIRYHEAEIAKLEKMLETAGVSYDEGTLRGRILAQLAVGPLSSAKLLELTGAKPNTLYVQLSRMVKAGLIHKNELGEYKVSQ